MPKGITSTPAYRTIRSINGSVTGTSYRSGDGLRSGSSSSGWDAVSCRTVPNASGGWSVTAIAADGTSTVSLYTKAGLEQTSQLPSAAPASLVLVASTTTIKNPLGRLLSSSDSRTGTSGTATCADHTPAGQARKVSLSGTSDRDTRITFDQMGRQLKVDAPDTVLASNVGGATSKNETHTSYYPTGRSKAQ